MDSRLVINEDALLTRKQVAVRLSVSPRTVDHMTQRGELPPPLRRGKRWVRYRIEDVGACVRRILRLADA